MSLQLPLQMPPARQSGMEAALDHAGPEWRVSAYTFLCRYAKAHEVIGCEEVADAHEAASGLLPPDRRAWAGLYQRAVRERVMAFLDNNGFSKRRHSPARRYRSLVA